MSVYSVRDSLKGVSHGANGTDVVGFVWCGGLDRAGPYHDPIREGEIDCAECLRLNG